MTAATTIAATTKTLMCSAPHYNGAVAVRAGSRAGPAHAADGDTFPGVTCSVASREKYRDGLQSRGIPHAHETTRDLRRPLLSTTTAPARQGSKSRGARGRRSPPPR